MIILVEVVLLAFAGTVTVWLDRESYFNINAWLLWALMIGLSSIGAGAALIGTISALAANYWGLRVFFALSLASLAITGTFSYLFLRLARDTSERFHKQQAKHNWGL